MLPPLWERDPVSIPLAKAHGQGHLPSTLLIHGAPGVGKRTLALWLGRLILCQSPTGSGPCESCPSCRLALRLEHPDLNWFFPLPRPKGAGSPERLQEALEAARHDRLAAIREDPLDPTPPDTPRGLYLAIVQTLRRMAQRRPSMGTHQVFVVSEAELLVPQAASPEAANALLKLLEEPPANTSFILTTQALGAVLDTIRSRCTLLHLPPLTEDQVERFLLDAGGEERDGDAAQRAARLSQGSIGRALGFLTPAEGELGHLEGLRQQSFQLLRAGLSVDPGDGLGLALSFPAFKARSLAELLGHLEEWLRDLAAAASDRRDAIHNQDAGDYLTRIAREREVEPWAVLEAVQEVQDARELAAGNVNPQLIVAGLVDRLRAVLVGAHTHPDERTASPHA